MSHDQIDIRQLALNRPKAEPKQRRRRARLTRYLIPAAIVCLFVALLAFAIGEQWLPRKGVTVVPVIVTRAEVQQEGTPLFQAAGWIEPRPTPIHAAALTGGVVQDLLVVEGQEVNAGDPLARLIDVDAKIALRQAKAIRDLRQAELQSVEGELAAAKLRMENPVHLDAALAEAQSMLVKADVSGAELPFLISAAKARVEYSQENLEGKEAARDAVAGRLIQQAKSELAKNVAELRELEQRVPLIKRESDALRRKVEALSKQRELLIEESRQLADALGRRKGAQAKLDEAEIAVEQAELALSRTVVRSPITGRVLGLIASPGTRVTGLESSGTQSSSTVVDLYDPRKLQVRADVRLEDVPLVQPGQPVEIATASSKEPIVGIVLMPTSSANIQKNTLEVKVAISNPPATIRPEMLVTATFLAPPQSSSDKEDTPPERIFIPRQLVQNSGGTSSVWIVAPSGTAKFQAVALGKAGTDELIEVTDGIQLTDRIISSGHQDLKEGMRLSVIGEDASLGIGRPRS